MKENIRLVVCVLEWMDFREDLIYILKSISFVNLNRNYTNLYVRKTTGTWTSLKTVSGYLLEIAPSQKEQQKQLAIIFSFLFSLAS